MLLYLASTQIVQMSRKQLLAGAVAMMLILPTGASFAEGVADRDPETDRLIAQLIEEKSDSVGDLEDLDLTDFELSSDEDDHANLYLTIYQNEFNNAYERALEKTAGITGYNQFTVKEVVETDSIEGLDDDLKVAAKISVEIEKLFEEEFIIAQESTRLVQDAYFFDIYANGIEDDADFDLIIELQEIHDLLFTERPPVAIQSNPTKNAGSLKPRGKESSGRRTSSSSEETTTRTSGLDVADDASEGSVGEVGTSETETADTAEEVTVEPLICPADPELLDSLQDHADRQQDFVDEVLNGEDSSDSDGSDQSDRDGNGNNDDGDRSNIDLGGERQRRSSLAESLLPEEDPCPEGVIFCIEIEQIFARTQNYFPGDSSCTACQIGKINKAMNEDLLPNNLYPGKVTGNLGEVAECKDAFFHLPLGLNISIESLPPASNNNEAREAILNSRASDDGPKSSPSDKLDEVDTVAKSVNEGSGDLVQRTVGSNKTQAEINSQKVVEDSALGAVESTEKYTGFTKVLIPKMKEFNAYIDSIKSQLVDISFTVNKIANKKSCS